MWSFVKNLKGSGIGIANTFLKEIDEIHQKLYTVLKEAKRTGQKASFKVDKLIISGQVYRGEEVENLVHYEQLKRSADTGPKRQSTPRYIFVSFKRYLT